MPLLILQSKPLQHRKIKMVGKSNQALILRDPFANRLLKRLSVQGPTLFQTLNSEIVLYPF